MEIYHSIPKYPESITPQTVLIRMIEGLGFRFRWATEGLKPEDYAFRPSNDCMSIEELVRHIWGLVNWICLSMDSKRFRKQEDILQARMSILEMIIELRKTIFEMEVEDLNKVTIDGNPF